MIEGSPPEMAEQIPRRNLKRQITCTDQEKQASYVKEEIIITGEAFERELYPTDKKSHCLSVQVQSIVKEEVMIPDDADLIDDASLNVNKIDNQLLPEQVKENELRGVNRLVKKSVETPNSDADAFPEASKVQLDQSATANNNFNQSLDTVSKTFTDNGSIIISSDISENRCNEPLQNSNTIENNNSAKKKNKTSKKKESILKDTRKEEVRAKLKSYCPKCKQDFESFDLEKIKECMKCRAVLITHCVKCHLRFRLSSSAFEHARKDKCKPKPTFHCHDCGYKSQYKQVLARHIESQHLDKEPADFCECSKCGKSFKMRYNKDSHEKLCGQSFLKCHLCEFQVKKPYTLKRHLRIHQKNSTQHLENSNPKSLINVSNIKDLIESSAAVRRIPQVLKGLIIFGNVKVNQKKKPLKTKLFVFFCEKCKSIEKGTSIKKCTKKCQKCDTAMKYRCLNCKEIHPNICAMYRHLAMCILDEYHSCNDCDYKVIEKKKIRRHVLQKHVYQFDMNNYVKCLQCNEKFHGWENMYRHESVCEKNVPGNLNTKAGTQGNPFNSGTKSKLHLENAFFAMTQRMTKEEIHKTDHWVKEYCPKCGNNNIGNINSRIRCEKCQSSNKFLCLYTLCNSDFSTLAGIRIHIKRIHLYGDQKISGICKKCGKNIASLWVWRNHTKTCGLEAKSYSCDMCDYKTKKKYVITRHKIKKHKELVAHKICVCKKCGKQFLDTTTLDQHERRFCGGPNTVFKCTNCYYICYSRMKMTAHLKDEQCFEGNLKSK